MAENRDVLSLVAATGTGTLRYQWRRSGISLVDDERISGTTTSDLIIANVGMNDGKGFYDVVITDDCGSRTSAPASLTVTCPAPVVADLDYDCDVDLDDIAVFQICAAGANVPFNPACPRARGNQTRSVADFEGDQDVDMDDFAVLQRCFGGTNEPPSVGCADFQRVLQNWRHNMDRRTFLKTVPAVAVLAAEGSSLAQTAAPARPVSNLKPILLPKPEKEGGKSVIAALWDRKTIREISSQKLPPQMLSNLLWAAWGVNREQGPRGGIGRTAASARNFQETDLYVVLPDGIYLYEAVPHRLVPVAAGDHRAKLGRGASAEAPVTLLFVVDVSRYGEGAPRAGGDTESQKFCYYVATGMIAGNVHLFAAAHGLAAWFHGCDKEALSRELKLREQHRLIYAQTVGYPA